MLLQTWKQYMKEDDYTFLLQYVENIKNNTPNDKMIVLHGPSRSGKSTLKRDIQTYLGEEKCGDGMMSGELIYHEDIPSLVFFCDVTKNAISKKNNKAIINLIRNKNIVTFYGIT